MNDKLTLPGTRDFTMPWLGPVRAEWYGAYCSQGHELKRIKKRTLAITVRGNRIELTGYIRPADKYHTVVCGKCLGIA